MRNTHASSWTCLLLGYQENCGSSLQLISRGVNNVPSSSVTDAWIHHNEVVSWPASTICLFIHLASPSLAWLFHLCLIFQFSFSSFALFLAGSVADFLLFHFPEPLFAFLLWPPALLPTSALLSFNLFISSTWNRISKNYIKRGIIMLMIALFNRQLFLLPSSRRVTMQPLKAKLVLLPYGLWVVRNPP